MVNILYIRSPDAYKGGIRNYSDTIIALLRRYAGTHYFITDLSTVLEVTGECFNAPNRKVISRVIATLVKQGYFDQFNAVIADIGVMESVEFFILFEIKRLNPNLPTIVTIHDPPATVVNLFPVFARFQEITIARALRKVVNKFFGQFVERRFFNQGHNLVALSKRGQEELLEKLVRLGCSGIHVSFIPHVNLIDTFDEVVRLSTPERKLHIGYLGFISHAKGVDLLLGSLAVLKQTAPDLLDTFHLTIAGGTVRNSDKTYLSSLQQFVREHALEEQVSFSGYLQDDDIPDFIRSLDLMVLPYRESGSGAASGPLMWARALGIPVLASDARNFAEVIKPGTDGLLFEAELGCSAIVEQLKSYICNISLRETLKSGAIIARNENSWEKTAIRFGSLLDKICEMEVS